MRDQPTRARSIGRPSAGNLPGQSRIFSQCPGSRPGRHLSRIFFWAFYSMYFVPDLKLFVPDSNPKPAKRSAKIDLKQNFGNFRACKKVAMPESRIWSFLSRIFFRNLQKGRQKSNFSDPKLSRPNFLKSRIFFEISLVVLTSGQLNILAHFMKLEEKC